MDVYRKFTEALRSLSPRGGVIVAFSGGADSVCLLHLFLTAAARGDFPHPVAAAHLNHALRGEESDRDERFCADFCAAHGVSFFSEKIDVSAAAKAEKRGVEETARSLRYAYFARLLAAESAYTCVATAHNKNDLCETMLFNLGRGTALDGLCSIPARRGDILRPLLGVRREEILAYNEENRLEFVTDSTNQSLDYSRNRIRHNVLPALTEIAPSCVDNMARSAALLARDADYLDGEAKRAYEVLVSDGALDTKKAQNLHRALLSRVVKLLYNQSKLPHREGVHLENLHIEQLCDRIEKGDTDFTLDLPACAAVCSRGLLRFVKEPPRPPAFCFPLTIGVPIDLPSGECLLVTTEAEPKDFPQKPLAVLDAGAFRGKPCFVRSRKEGDTIVYFKKTHKVKRVIADAKLDAGQKAKLFFLSAGDTVLYIRATATADSAYFRGGEPLRVFCRNIQNKGDA